MSDPTPMKRAMSFDNRWNQAASQPLEQADLSALYSPPPGNSQALAGVMQQASQLAPNGIPWQQWRRSDNVEDFRNPEQGGTELLKQWFNALQMMKLLQSISQK